MSSSITDIVSELSQAAVLAQDYGGLSVQVKTNYTPALTVFNQLGQPGAGAAAAGLLGLQGGVRVLDASGNVVAQIGDWPATDPVRVTMAIGVIGLLSYGLVKLIQGSSRGR